MDASLEDWLSEFVERRERGENLTPEAFLREHPEGGARLREALRTLASTEDLLPAQAPDLPARVGPYRVLRELGHGGMGRVFEVDDPEHPGDTLALKLLHVSLAGETRALERFRREGEVLERLLHPGIVRVHEVGMLEQRPYLAMERIDGSSLAELLRAARSGESNAPRFGTPGWHTRVARLVARAARAVAAAHAAGVLHRDLNPRNVLVRPDGEPVVIDFGLMRAEGAPTLTGSGDLLGTPQYMAPEQARGERLDERSDVFGLGTILWELLFGRPPRAKEDTLALVRRAGSRPLAVPPEAADLPADLRIVLARATSFHPRWRYASCAELAADLEHVLAREPIVARAPGLAQRGLELWTSQRRLLSTAGSLLLAVVVGLIVWHARRPVNRVEERIRATSEVVRAWFDGDQVEARAALERYRKLERDPPLVAFLNALVAEQLDTACEAPAERALFAGERARRAGRTLEALQSFQTAWDLAQGYPLILLLQGLTAFEGERYSAARRPLEYSASAFGSSPRLHRTLGALYSRLELPSDSARAWRAVTELAPSDEVAWLELARARARAGDEPGALEAAQRALALATEPGDRLLHDLLAEWERTGLLALAGKLRSVSR